MPVTSEQVGVGEAVGEGPPQRLGAAVAVGLEAAHDPPPAPGPGGRQRGRHLGGQVVVAVDEHHPGGLAPDLEPAGHPPEATQGGRGASAGPRPSWWASASAAAALRALWAPGAAGTCDRRPRSPSCSSVKPHAGALRGDLRDPVVARRRGAVGDGSARRAQPARRRPGRRRRGRPDRPGAATNRGERRSQLCLAAPVLEVVGLDVGDDRAPRAEGEERAVALVGLDHERARRRPTPRCGPGRRPRHRRPSPAPRRPPPAPWRAGRRWWSCRGCRPPRSCAGRRRAPPAPRTGAAPGRPPAGPPRPGGGRSGWRWT